LVWARIRIRSLSVSIAESHCLPRLPFSPLDAPSSGFGNGLLVVSDAAAQIIAGPGYEAHLLNRRLVSAWPRKHVADLGDFTFRLLVPGVELGAKRFAGRVLEGPRVYSDVLLGIGVAQRDDLAVTDSTAKYIEVAV
jgi:hypothetical protein